MEAVAEKKKKVHHGRNIRIVRTSQNVTQEDLAFRLNLSQSKVSALELDEVIEDAVLDKFATALNVPVNFLKNFEPEEVINSYNVYENEITMTQTENSQGDINVQKIIEKEENIYNPIDKVSELYERLLKEKDKQIDELKKEVEKLSKK
ncbi:helix-turn-helix transcriptional regulator [Dysgonomonas sp. HDW5B]|uniref:helix-turn-helix domain-containing protein n=1 Tax=Dysgonomonas sp. HDW5B TaxID=2714927 RepID=UPI00140DCC90|nr:helix-turn-helix transcriptional regulator [Dysgonomonas sp. HDW5B]QIK53803.1 helix-turn-helix transcriptional regulator [Dysgonomonas sp. HDW5B]